MADVAQHRARHHDAAGAAETLRRPPHVHDAHTVRETGDRRADKIEHEAADDDRPAAEAVRNRPEDQLPDSLEDQEHGDDRLHGNDRRSEVGLHRPERGQRDVAREGAHRQQQAAEDDEQGMAHAEGKPPEAEPQTVPCVFIGPRRPEWAA